MSKSRISKSIVSPGIVVGMLSFMTGCAQTNQSLIQTHLLAKNLQNNPSNAQVIYAPASRRATYFADPQGNLRYCAEPMPDATSDQSHTATVDLAQSGSAEVGKGGASIKGSTSNSSKIASDQKTTSKEMAGRSSAVLLARELMYRLCELSLNFKPGDPAYELAAKQYKEVSDVIRDIATAERLQASAQKNDAEAGKLRNQEKLAEITAAAVVRGDLVVGYTLKLMTLVTKVEDKKCSVDADKMTGLFADAKFSGIREAFLRITRCTELQAELSELALETLESIVKASEAQKPKPDAGNKPKQGA